MSSNGGFTLIETAVATLISVALVVAIGVLGNNLIRQRANADSNSAATNLAQLRMEKLLALPVDDTLLTAGTHGPPGAGGSPCVSPPCRVDETEATTLVGPYLISWVIEDDTPWTPAGAPKSKKITVTVSHVTNPFVRCQLETYRKVS